MKYISCKFILYEENNRRERKPRKGYGEKNHLLKKKKEKKPDCILRKRV